jgi:hypothetical protein
MTKMRLIAVALGSVLVSACGGGVDEITEKQCPEIAVLTTADSWQGDGVSAQMRTASLTCFIDRDEDELMADITLRGTASKTGSKLPFFVASLDKDDRIINRVQYAVTIANNEFSFSLPRYGYGTRQDVARRPRLVAGFVLSEAQLNANRKAFRASLGLK